MEHNVCNLAFRVNLHTLRGTLAALNKLNILYLGYGCMVFKKTHNMIQNLNIKNNFIKILIFNDFFEII